MAKVMSLGEELMVASPPSVRGPGQLTPPLELKIAPLPEMPVPEIVSGSALLRVTPLRSSAASVPAMTVPPAVVPSGVTGLEIDAGKPRCKRPQAAVNVPENEMLPVSSSVPLPVLSPWSRIDDPVACSVMFAEIEMEEVDPMTIVLFVEPRLMVIGAKPGLRVDLIVRLLLAALLARPVIEKMTFGTDRTVEPLKMMVPAAVEAALVLLLPNRIGICGPTIESAPSE